jgi:hypothetical protein
MVDLGYAAQPHWSTVHPITGGIGSETIFQKRAPLSRKPINREKGCVEGILFRALEKPHCQEPDHSIGQPR